MGMHANDIINGDVDQFTGEWIGGGQGFPRQSHGVGGNRSNTFVKKADGTFRNIDHNPKEFTKGTRAIRKELAILIKTTISDNPEKNEDVIVNECRQAINTKYGKGWRGQI